MTGMSAAVNPPPPRGLTEKQRVFVSIALVVAGMLVLATVNHYLRSRPEPAAPATVWAALPLTTLPGREYNPSFSPDGSQVAFIWDGEDGTPHVYIKLVGLGRPLRLTNDRHEDHGAAWSPDGRFIAFYRDVTPERMAVILVPALGGAERKLAEFDIQPWTVSWPAWFPDPSRW
jgi:dipeptidyl aminopeptidase/acylaminoacyl peptidase